ncbi:MAG: metallophosphatase [Paludibacteraceae bacterium]|nr:metallophosphatase [Paludibacteraceae bacterium]
MKSKLLFFLLLFSACQTKEDLVLLCTNDTHSQVEVCGANMKKMSGLGGYEYRASAIDSIRCANPDLLLFDAGDFSQGTPYFNLYKGRVEVLAYNKMQYDAVTLGNHEFDNGIDTLAARLREATFKVVCTNYEVSGTPLEGVVKKTVIFSRAGWKIGVIGLGVNPEGLILKSNFGDVQYLEPIAVANHYADSLKQHCGCDVVVALSHLGSAYDTENIEPCDEYLAQNSSSIDIIMGGHTHKQVCKKCVNLKGDSVLLIQSGKSGAYLGKVKLTK